MARLSRARGMVRSLAWSYGSIARQRAMTARYRHFLRPGDLAFDVGAHAGNRVRAFTRAGARVVAVEPQPDFVAVLRLLYGRDRRVRIEPCAVGATPGTGWLHLSSRNPTVSTLAPSWMTDVQADPTFHDVVWDERVEVPLRTLDELIERHGEPRFCKLDVEGFELEALKGLSRPLTALSFEYIPVTMHRALACVRRLTELGHYRFTFSRLETFTWATDDWLDAPAILSVLGALDPTERPGDVYAVRADAPGAP